MVVKDGADKVTVPTLGPRTTKTEAGPTVRSPFPAAPITRVSDRVNGTVTPPNVRVHESTPVWVPGGAAGLSRLMRLAVGSRATVTGTFRVRSTLPVKFTGRTVTGPTTT